MDVDDYVRADKKKLQIWMASSVLIILDMDDYTRRYGLLCPSLHDYFRVDVDGYVRVVMELHRVSVNL